MREIPWGRVALALEIVLVPIGLVVLIWLTATERAIQLVANASGSILIGVVVSQVSAVLFAMRLRVLLAAADLPLSRLGATRLHVQSLFYFFFVPFGVGTEIFKVAKLVSIFPTANRVTIATAVIFDRLLGFVTVLIVAFASGLLVAPRLSGEFDVPKSLLLIGGLIGVLTLAVALVLWLVRKGMLHDLRRFIPAIKAAGAPAVGLSVAMQLTLALAVYLAAQSWSIELGYLDVLLATAGAIIFQVIPLSILGIGAAEVAGVAIYLLLGLTETDALLMVSSWYAYRLLTALLGGLWQLHDRIAREPRIC